MAWIGASLAHEIPLTEKNQPKTGLYERWFRKDESFFSTQAYFATCRGNAQGHLGSFLYPRIAF